MKSKAILMTLAMMSAALAGCTGSDGVTEIDDETLQQLFDDNIQDFMNNTSVIVNQEIHYHNNTTMIIDDGDYSNSVVNEYNNTTNIDGGEVINNYEENDYSNTNYSLGGHSVSFGEGVNGTSFGNGLMFVTHLEFTAMDLFPDYETIDYRGNSFSYEYEYYDYLTNDYRNDTFDLDCISFYIVGSQSNNSSSQVSYWADNNNYWNAWSNEYNSTIADLLQEAAGQHSVRAICDERYIAANPLADGTSTYSHNFLEVDIPAGYAIRYIQLDSLHTWYGCSGTSRYSDCYDADRHENQTSEDFHTFSEGVNPRYSQLYGGWENITISFDLKLLNEGEYYGNSNFGNYIGAFSVWPSSEYSFTLYYEFVPVIPVE